jgi:hypothetical protein
LLGPSLVFGFVIIFTQMTGILGRGSARHKAPTYTGQFKLRINADTDIHALSGIETTTTVFERVKTVHALDRAATQHIF